MQSLLLGGLEKAKQRFLLDYPEYASTRSIDRLRSEEYSRLDREGHVYLDYTGGGLYSESQVKAHHELLAGHVFGNPHSTNPTSSAATELIEQTRRAILETFNADPEVHLVIFTQNASGALKLVGESYPFTAGSNYLMTFDNHNSVNGIREFARAKGARVTYTPVLPPDMVIDGPSLERNLELATGEASHLFAFPAQSNFSGVQHSLEWVAKAKARGWDVLLDAAAYVPTNRLDLSKVEADFVPVSFYKMFGYPTGLGCLIARREALAKLRRPWFAGGTITVASVTGNRHFLHEGGEAFEDGTLNYLGIPAITIGLAHLQRIGIDSIHLRVKCLTGWLVRELAALRHDNGAPLLRIYGPLSADGRGGTVTMNFFDPHGKFISHLDVEKEANKAKISLRTGCFCNPGGGELALGISSEELSRCLAPGDRMPLADFRRCVDEKSTGAVRVSLGLASDFGDAYRFVDFARRMLDRDASSI